MPPGPAINPHISASRATIFESLKLFRCGEGDRGMHVGRGEVVYVVVDYATTPEKYIEQIRYTLYFGWIKF